MTFDQLASELPEFNPTHGLVGADLGDLDEHLPLIPPVSVPAVRAQVFTSAAAPVAKASAPPPTSSARLSTMLDAFNKLA